MTFLKIRSLPKFSIPHLAVVLILTSLLRAQSPDSTVVVPEPSLQTDSSIHIANDTTPSVDLKLSADSLDQEFDDSAPTGIHAFSVFAGPLYRLSRINKEWAHFGGAQAGFLLNHQWVLAFSAFGLKQDIEADPPYKQNLILNYGGVSLEYIIMPFERVHGVVSVFSGMGILDLDKLSKAEDYIYLVEPKWAFQTIVNKNLLFDLELGYRILFGRDKEYTRKFWDTSHFFLGLGFRFGSFKIDYDP